MKTEVVPDRYERGKVAVFIHHQIPTLDWDFRCWEDKRKSLADASIQLRQDFYQSGRSWVLHETPHGFHAVGEGPEGVPVNLDCDQAYLRLRGKTFCWRVTPKADHKPAAYGLLRTIGAPSEELVKEVRKYLLVAKSATQWDLSYREIPFWFEGVYAFEWQGKLKWTTRSSRGAWKGTKAPRELSFQKINELRDQAWDLYQAHLKSLK